MLRTRTFDTITLLFGSENSAIDVFDTVKELTVASACPRIRSISLLTPVTASVTQLYAFYFVPNPPYVETNGWSLFSPREEFGRMGVGSRTKAWRFTDINKDYSVRRSATSHLTYSYITDSNPVLAHLSRSLRRSYTDQRYDLAIRGEVS